METDRDWKALFEQTYPEGVDPYSYISVSELERIAAELRAPGPATAAACVSGAARRRRAVP